MSDLSHIITAAFLISIAVMPDPPPPTRIPWKLINIGMGFLAGLVIMGVGK